MSEIEQTKKEPETAACKHDLVPERVFEDEEHGKVIIVYQCTVCESISWDWAAKLVWAGGY